MGNETLTVPATAGVLVGPDTLRQVFNDTDSEVLWLILGAPEELEFLQGSKSPMDLSKIYPVDPTQLPPELAGVSWPPRSIPTPTCPTTSPSPAGCDPDARRSSNRQSASSSKPRLRTEACWVPR